MVVAPQFAKFATIRMSATVSAIIVNYRADDHVRRLVKELKQQSHPPDEIHVLDNTNEERGLGEAWNLGARQSKSEYLLFLNPDVSLPREFIETLLIVAHARPRCALISSQVLRKNGKIEETASTIPDPLSALIEFSFLRKIPLLGDWVHAHYRLGNFKHTTSRPVPCLAACAWLMRTKDFQEIGGFDPKLYLYFEEFDVCSRLAQKKKEVYFSAETSLIHFGQASTSQVPVSSRQHFLHSRAYWMKKRYGLLGMLVAAFLSISEKMKTK